MMIFSADQWLAGSFAKSQQAHDAQVLPTLGTDVINPDSTGALQIDLATLKYSPGAQIVYDKFHVMRHLSDALDQVRRSEYKRVNDKERKFIKGQRYTLLFHKASLDLEGPRTCTRC